MSRGELIYQDHVYDDYGAGTSDPSAAQFQRLEPTDGRYRYPTDEERFAGNVADLFQLRVAVDGDRVVLLAWLDALRRRDTTVVSVAFDVDGRAGAGRAAVAPRLGAPGVRRRRRRDRVGDRGGPRRPPHGTSHATRRGGGRRHRQRDRGGGADGAPGRGAVEGLGRDGVVGPRHGGVHGRAVRRSHPVEAGQRRQRRRGPGLQRGVPRPRVGRLLRGAAGRRAPDR